MTAVKDLVHWSPPAGSVMLDTFVSVPFESPTSRDLFLRKKNEVTSVASGWFMSYLQVGSEAVVFPVERSHRPSCIPGLVSERTKAASLVLRFSS